MSMLAIMALVLSPFILMIIGFVKALNKDIRIRKNGRIFFLAGIILLVVLIIYISSILSSANFGGAN